jgi:L,D-transpeptidase catalytic domain
LITMPSIDVSKYRRTLVGLRILTALALVGVVPSSEAQDFGPGFGSAPRQMRRPLRMRHPLTHRSHGHDVGEPRKPAEAKPVGGPLFAILSLSEQHISIYNSAGLVARSKVSTGMPGHRTPTGIFSIIGRERWHHSNIYSGAPMPYMQRITWSGVALHLGVVPGYPASHGCIRLPSGFAERLWGMTKVGERVVVTTYEVAPAPFANAKLPVARIRPAPAGVDGAALAALATPAVTATSEPAMAAKAKMLNPIEYAQVLKARAAADAAAATAAIKPAAQHAAAKAEGARRAAGLLRAAEAEHAQIEARLRAKVRAREAATPQATEPAAAAVSAAEAQLRESADRLKAAAEGASAMADEAALAEHSLEELRTDLAKSQALGKEAARRNSPVSILVSKKDKRIYVRQGLAPVLEAPAVVRDPQIPLGTHLYMATGVQADGQSLSWTVISLPAPPEPEHRGRRRDRAGETSNERAQPLPASNAADALERIDISADVADRISELLWTGGSLIVSDQPLSDETGDFGTDIVVKTR